jgi:hypothetical protein
MATGCAVLRRGVTPRLPVIAARGRHLKCGPSLRRGAPGALSSASGWPEGPDHNGTGSSLIAQMGDDS